MALFVLAVSPAAMGDESMYQIAVLHRSSCYGFAIESVSSDAISSCLGIPYGWDAIGEYAAAANGTIVFDEPSAVPDNNGGYGAIWLVRPNGSMTELDSSDYDQHPTISYDGAKVVFARFDPTSKSADIYSVNSDGSDLHEVVHGGANLLTVPAISPDGTAIAYWCLPANFYSANADCGPLTDGSYRSSGLMRVNIDGSNRRMIVIGAGDAVFNGPSGISWSPDGKWLAMDGLNEVLAPPPWRYLFKYRTDGSDLFNNLDPTRQITPHSSAAWNPSLPQFSPDGSQVLFMDSVDGTGINGDQGNFSYLIGVDGANPHQIFLNPETTCTNSMCGPTSYGAFIPATATPAAPPALVDATHETVPSVAHLTVPAARRTLNAAHLTVGNMRLQSSSQIPAGRVISQSPSAGVRAHRTTKQGPPVALVVSTGLTRILTIAMRGAGSGTVTSTPAGIACGSTCTHRFAKGSTVKLVATAASGSIFVGWSGACTGTGVCRVAMSQARTVSATFSHQ